ncbi:MAG: hypothetical protein HY329_28525 [Chloroflexi bacterium]|nr:hypothetical protein [Chloroflexota bacterium]
MTGSDIMLIPATYMLMIAIPWFLLLSAFAWAGIMFVTVGNSPPAAEPRPAAPLPDVVELLAEANAIANEYQPDEVSAEPVESRLPAPAGLAHLKVVAVNGACRAGYRVGDTFTCTPDGQVSPAICGPAKRALQPLLADMIAGRPDAPCRVSCPIYDHMLVFELNGTSRSDVVDGTGERELIAI